MKASITWAVLRITAGLMLWSAPLTSNGQFGSYTTNNGAITIIGQDEFAAPGETLIIPDTIDGLPVTSIGDYAFDGPFPPRTLVIGNNVTNLGASAFGNWPNLTNLSLGNSLVTIGDANFFACGKLASVNVPNTVSSIGTGAFSNNDSLTNVILGEALTNIGPGAFGLCPNLESFSATQQNQFFSTQDGVLFDKKKATLVRCPEARRGAYTIPNSVTSIGSAAFENCTSLTNVLIPTNVTMIGISAFEECGLTSVTIPERITEIAAQAFHLCTRLTNVTIPDSVTNIGLNAFNSCWSLTSVMIGKSVTSIQPNAFAFCGLTAVTIPANVVSIGDGAFGACATLTALTVDSLNPAYSSVAGVLFDKSQTTLIQFPQGKAGSYAIPHSVTSIGNSAFDSCASLTNVTIPNSVTNIGLHAFNRCLALASVYFEGDAPAFVGYAFGDFQQPMDPVTIYYVPGTTGWGPTITGIPTSVWEPQVQPSDPRFGVLTNHFGFNINWASGMVVVVEATTNLASPIWSPVQTNILTGGSSPFIDPQWTNYPRRFYRVRWP